MTKKQFENLENYEKFEIYEEETGLRVWTDIESEVRIYVDYAKNKYDICDVIYQMNGEKYLSSIYEYAIVEVSDYYECPSFVIGFDYFDELIDYIAEELEKMAYFDIEDEESEEE